MPLYETESFVLRSYNLAEADRIVVFYTHDHGIVRGVAKGAKRLNSKFGSTLEPFSTVNLTYFQKEDRELVSIQHVELVRSSFAAASDPNILRTLSYLSELLIAFQPPNDPNETVYRMIMACVRATARSESDLNALQMYFELWLLRLGGYLPEWGKCYQCGGVLADGGDYVLADGFHLFCGNCRKNGGLRVTSNQRGSYLDSQRLSPERFIDSVSGRPEDITAISAILKRMIAHAIGRDVLVGAAVDLGVVNS